MREEFLERLRADEALREEVRRQLLTEELLALPGRFDRLTEQVGETTAAVRDLALAQQRTEAALQRQGEQIQRQGEQIRALVEAQQRTDAAIQNLTEAQRRTEAALQRQGEQIQRQGEQIQALVEAQQRTDAAIQNLTEAQRQTEAALRDTQKVLQELVNWQRGEVGRREGERYERDTIRSAPALFNGGQGGAPDQLWVQQRLTEWLKPLFSDAPFLREDDPFLADLVWWKGEQIAVVEISHQVNGYDVFRAARRAETLRRAGAQALAVVIGRDWASSESRFEARLQNVEWKVGSDLSEGFLTFRRRPSE